MVRYDQRGFGRSGYPREPFSPVADLDAVVAVTAVVLIRRRRRSQACCEPGAAGWPGKAGTAAARRPVAR